MPRCNILTCVGEYNSEKVLNCFLKNIDSHKANSPHFFFSKGNNAEMKKPSCGNCRVQRAGCVFSVCATAYHQKERTKKDIIS